MIASSGEMRGSIGATSGQSPACCGEDLAESLVGAECLARKARRPWWESSAEAARRGESSRFGWHAPKSSERAARGDLQAGGSGGGCGSLCCCCCAFRPPRAEQAEERP